VIMITHDVDEAVLLSDRIVMMSNGPAATIGEILAIELARPRERLALADDAQYNHYRSAVLKFLYERQRRPEDNEQDSKPEAAQVTGESGKSDKPGEAADTAALRLVSG
jgi:nitrate/nitrite transport system ATP-binding protein